VRRIAGIFNTFVSGSLILLFTLPCEVYRTRAVCNKSASSSVYSTLFVSIFAQFLYRLLLIYAHQMRDYILATYTQKKGDPTLQNNRGVSQWSMFAGNIVLFLWNLIDSELDNCHLVTTLVGLTVYPLDAIRRNMMVTESLIILTKKTDQKNKDSR
jgi:hypothetical protein